MSQARRTRHLARKRHMRDEGRRKNKAPVTSSLFWLFRSHMPTIYWLTAMMSKGPIKTRFITRAKIPGVIRYCTNGEEFRRCLRELPPKSCGFCSNPFAYSASSIPILVLLLKGKNVRAFSCQIWSTSKVFMFKTIQARPVGRVRTVQGQLSQLVIRGLK